MSEQITTAAEDDGQCDHWLIGAKVGVPGMYDLRCTREAGHPRDRRESHVAGSTTWGEAAGEYHRASSPEPDAPVAAGATVTEWGLAWPGDTEAWKTSIRSTMAEVAELLPFAAEDAVVVTRQAHPWTPVTEGVRDDG